MNEKESESESEMIRVSFDVTREQFEDMQRSSVYMDVFGTVRSTGTTDALPDGNGGVVRWSGRSL